MLFKYLNVKGKGGEIYKMEWLEVEGKIQNQEDIQWKLIWIK